MKKRNFIGKFLTANIDGENYDENVRKAVIITLFSIVGIISMMYFLAGGIIHHRYFYSIVIFFFMIFTMGTLFMFQKYKNTKLASIFIVTLMLLLEIALFTTIGESTTGMFWFYLFPMLAFFMLGRKTGIFFSSLLLIIAIILLKIEFDGVKKYPVILHERFIISYFVTGLLAYIFESIREITFEAFIKADKEKSEYLEETLQQKEEIATQAELLQEKNIELEQLSIAAREADNSIIITNVKTEIEWVNRGFTKMLQYTLKEFQDLCPTLLECSTSKNIIEKSIIDKKSQTYFSHFILKDGTKIWVQSTVTPVLNEEDEVVKLVIVESDITAQKLAEQEINEKNEELNQQKNELLKKNALILEKNDAIRQSIEYALTIQRSILPNLNEFNQVFDNFIFYKPKDIVSGDFYWMKRINDCYFIAVVDCTGHGVPGAFMSILGSRILDEIVMYQHYESPAKILDELDKQLVYSLHQKNSKNSDGMDVAFCKIEDFETSEKVKITYCGAKRPLIYYDVDENEIISLKGVRKGIGGYRLAVSKVEFKDSELLLPKKSEIYLTSDGYIDQHNTQRKRIGTKNLLRLFDENKSNKMNNQREMLMNFLNDWQQTEMQTDDITIWGVRL